MIGEFLLTDYDDDEDKIIQDDNEENAIVLSPCANSCKKYFELLLKVIYQQHAVASSSWCHNSDQDKINNTFNSHSNNRKNFHPNQPNPRPVLTSSRCLVQGARGVGKTSLLIDWAITLALVVAKSQRCCSQCQSNPETCRCNDVDLILCRPVGFGKNHNNKKESCFPNNNNHDNNNNNNNNAELFPPFLLGQINSPQELLALYRIRVHTVRTRRQFLALLLKMQSRLSSEQPRRAILVDDLDNFGRDGAKVGIPDDDPARNYRQDMVLSQLGALLLDTTRFVTTALCSSSLNDNDTYRSRIPFVLAVSTTKRNNGRYTRPAWSQTLFPKSIYLNAPRSST